VGASQSGIAQVSAAQVSVTQVSVTQISIAQTYYYIGYADEVRFLQELQYNSITI
jgi:hypothetical protein